MVLINNIFSNCHAPSSVIGRPPKPGTSSSSNRPTLVLVQHKACHKSPNSLRRPPVLRQLHLSIPHGHTSKQKHININGIFIHSCVSVCVCLCVSIHTCVCPYTHTHACTAFLPRWIYTHTYQSPPICPTQRHIIHYRPAPRLQLLWFSTCIQWTIHQTNGR